MRYFHFLLAFARALGDFFRAISRRVLPKVCAQELLILAASLWITLACNISLWRAVLKGRDLMRPDTWGFIAGFGLSLTALNFLPAAFIGSRRTIKPLLALLLGVAGIASFFTDHFGVYIDPDMARNVLRTHPSEAGEFLTGALFAHLAIYLVLPLWVLYRIELTPRCWKQAALARGAALILVFSLGALGLFLNFQALAPLMRTHKEVRYLIIPGNVAVSFTKAMTAYSSAAPSHKRNIAPDAARKTGGIKRDKPVLLVIVAGETARAANWGEYLGPEGVLRNTTPELSQRDLIHFRQVESCGTSTEVSLPCMFSLQGRRHYNEKAIRESESLLHVLDRAGFRVTWLDNQGGCKGVCSGLEEQRLPPSTDPALCEGNACLDEILLSGLKAVLARAPEDRVVVLHPLGNHGPAYYKRYPLAFRRFTPTCDTADLRQCRKEEIINAYDNALLYADHVLSRLVDFLKTFEKAYDTALIYVSDHGESLGENGLFLHGIPYAIAPKEQTRVPMFMNFSPGYARAFELDLTCLRQVAEKPASHDNLFHTVLGLLDVTTRAREPWMDLSAECRGQRSKP